VARAIEIDQVARAAADEAGDLRSLRFAALVHDIGKGSGHDHSVVGEELARAAARRAGLEPDQVEEVAKIVRWHLLLVDTATRRDLDDGAVISQVADTIGDGRLLRLLYILSVADGRGTGPEGWNAWKAALVAELYRKALTALETGHIPSRNDVTQRAREVEAYEPSLAGRAEDLLATMPPSYLEATAVPDVVDDLRLLLQSPKKGEVRYRVYEGLEKGDAAITICVPDRPGTLARTAGVLALNRISVLHAQAFSTTSGLALERFVVKEPEAQAWERVTADLEAVYSGRLALEARLERKIRDYAPPSGLEVEVRVLQDASPHSTVIEVRSPDALGLLFALTAAFTDLDLDIHVAKIDTQAARVVDTFYVRNAWGEKLTSEQESEIERAIRHRIARLFGE
jgi:[protein-PII] uridylyltransferase